MEPMEHSPRRSAFLAVTTIVAVQSTIAQPAPQAVASADQHELVEKATPAAAPARPKKARKLLVIDLNIGRRGHPSIPYANLAIETMAWKTKAFEPVFSNDLTMLRAANIRQFDAIYLNNTIGDLFAEPKARDSLVSFLQAGGGLAGNHAVTVPSTEWPEPATAWPTRKFWSAWRTPRHRW